jgi:FecR-like protein
MNIRKKFLTSGFRFSLPTLGFAIFVFLFQTISLPPAFSKVQGKITRGEFIKIMAQHQPENPLFPKNPAQLSLNELYAQTVQSLKQQGFTTLDGKGSDAPLEDIEFVTVTYAFTGAPAGKSLLDQKLYLKRAGIVISADIGLATGVEGKVFQYSDGEDTGRKTQLASPVFMNDRIVTAVNSKVSFAFDDASTLSLGENAKVNITKHIYDPDQELRQTVVQVSLGAVRFAVTKSKSKDSTFEVITPAGIAGVRGTEFVVFVEPSGKTTFVGLEGSIETIPMSPSGRPGMPQIVSRGQTLEVSEYGKATWVTKASSNLLQQAKQKTTIQQTIFPNRGITKAQAEKAAETAKVARLAHDAEEKNNSASGDDDVKISPLPSDKENFSKAPLKLEKSLG